MQEAGDIITLSAGAWRLIEPLGRSSYGILWRAEPIAGGPAAALKLVNREQMAQALPAQRARWTESAANEIAFLRCLQPWDRRHIVGLLDSGEHEGLPAAALELLDGDLARHLEALRARGAALGLDRALDWLAQVNQALAKVHQYGWRYLDLKPSNLLIDRHGMLKLADFGTNRPLAELDAHSYTGTASWQAPEQFFAQDGGYRTDARSDYFALGALFYHLLTGTLLRYSAACGAAFREHGTAGAARLRGEHAGQLPAVLAPDEAELFARHARACGSGDGATAHALVLLRALLQPRPERRPRHALEISRLIAQARSDAGAAVTLQSTLRSAA